MDRGHGGIFPQACCGDQETACGEPRAGGRAASSWGRGSAALDRDDSAVGSPRAGRRSAGLSLGAELQVRRPLHPALALAGRLFEGLPDRESSSLSPPFRALRCERFRMPLTPPPGTGCALSESSPRVGGVADAPSGVPASWEGMPSAPVPRSGSSGTASTGAASAPRASGSSTGLRACFLVIGHFPTSRVRATVPLVAATLAPSLGQAHVATTTRGCARSTAIRRRSRERCAAAPRSQGPRSWRRSRDHGP